MKSTKIANTHFWSLILHKDYRQAGILVPKGVLVSQFSYLNIHKATIVDHVVFPTVGRILDSMLQLVSDTNYL